MKMVASMAVVMVQLKVVCLVFSMAALMVVSLALTMVDWLEFLLAE